MPYFSCLLPLTPLQKKAQCFALRLKGNLSITEPGKLPLRDAGQRRQEKRLSGSGTRCRGAYPQTVRGAHMQNRTDALPHVQSARGQMRVIVISGPTCSGKTEFAIKTAIENGAEIISCDSVQVYRGMDIGSAKASPQDMERVRHHLIDVADVSEKFDVANYVELAKKALSDIAKRGKNAVVVGGSGF